MKRTATTFMMLLLAGTAQAEDYSPYSSMAQRDYIIGQLKALNPKLVCDDGDYDGHMRVYHTGDALTMDVDDKRINVELDKDDKFIKAYCG